MDWNQTYREYVNMDRSLLYNVATNNADEVQYTLAVYVGNRRSKYLLAQIFAGFAVVDDNVTQAEYELFRRVTDTLFDEYYTYGEFCDIAREARSFAYTEDVKYYANQDDNLRYAIARLGLAICAIDDRISVAEQRFIEWF
jgi:hypothetical protein